MRLREAYKKEILPQLQEKLGYKNKFQVPQVEKVSINVGFGRHSRDNEYTKNLEESLKKITGQKPLFTKARKSVASFKIREGMVIGAKVTLRGKKMYDFLEKLVNITFPRVRDFRGINEDSVDEVGNITLGLRDNLPFPEIEAQDLETAHGLEVTIKTTAKNKEEGLELFRMLDFPFKKKE